MRLEQEVSLWRDGYIASKFSTQETALNVAQGAIDAIVSESELVELQGSGTTMYTSLSNLSVTVDGISGSVSSIETRVDTVEGNITSINSNVASLDLRADTLEGSVSSVTTDVESLQTWQREASLKITDSAIVATVTASSSWGDQTSAIATAQSTASSASSAAASAQSTANSAVSAASSAQSTANSAVSAASSAQSTANSAVSAAATAQSTADTAQSTASGAASAAATAQTTANRAVSAASSAQATANSAVSAAATAQSSANAAQSTANSAASAAAAAQTTADSKAKTYAQTTRPSSGMRSGDLWINTAGSANELYRYNGTAWVSVQDKEIGALETRVTTAESKITDAAIVDTVTSSSVWIAQSTDVNLLKTRMTTAESKITDSAIVNTVTGSTAWSTQTGRITTAQSTATSAASAASSAQATANSAVSAASAAQSTADGKNKTYYQYYAPTTGLVAGDLWVDTWSDNAVKRWNGTAWVDTGVKNFTEDIDDLSGDVSGLATRMTTAESKITETAIVNTVTASTAWGDLVDEAESVITQTANGIEMRVYENGVESSVLLSSDDMVVNAAGKLKINGGAIVSGGLSADYITTGDLTLGNGSGKIGSLSVYNGIEEIAALDYSGLWLAGQTYLGSTATYISLRPSFLGGLAIGAQEDFKGQAVGLLPQRIIVQNNADQVVDSTLLPCKCTTMDPYRFTVIGTSAISNVVATLGVADEAATDLVGRLYLRGCGSWDVAALTVSGSLVVSGNKNRCVSTPAYGDRLLYSYETATPFFGDIGEGVIGEDGVCAVAIDPVLAVTIRSTQYQVFLQRYGAGDAWVSERAGDHFTVTGTPGTAFGWELKAPQADFANERLEEFTQPAKTSGYNYGEEAAAYLSGLEKEILA